jgi:hypothetical protein
VTHRRLFAILVVCAVAVVGLFAQTAEKIDYQMMTKIRSEGLNHSQAMEIESWIADVYGPRMTGSPGYKQAADWAVKKMTSLGFSNVHIEKWPFGKGWQLKK